MIYLHENGVTVVATNEEKRGKVYELNGEKYYVARGVADIQRMVDSGEFPLNRVITSKLTSLNYLFQIQGGYDQAAVPSNFNDDISNWDTSKVLSMEEVFSGWPKFNQDISNWDTSRVESMYGMFKSSKYKGSYHMGPTSFNQDISNWDVSNVKNMSEMFLGATSFNQPIGNWDVSNVENMEYMFSGATSFNQDIGNWDVSNVKNMAHMFSDIDSIGILAFVGTLEYTRAGSTSFNQDISNWDVSNVNDMNGMFSGATSFNQPISNWDVSNVPGMNLMFSSATSFNQDIGNWDVSNVNDMSGMFSGATSFNQDIGNWDVSNVNGMSVMFSGATSFNQDISNWDVSSLGGVQNMFYGATSFNAPIGKWKLKSITNMENMFREATAFNQDISSWDVSNVTQMKGLFQDATSFNQNIRNWKLNEKLPKSPTIFKDAKAFNIKEYNPFLNKKAKKREVDTSTANLSPEDKKTISKIKKLLIDRDFEKIDLGLELLISLNNLELFETLLHDCKIGPNFSSLIHNKFFTGSGPAQPYLDYALINIIANAPQEAKIDDSLLLKNIFSPDTGKISFNDISNSELRDFLVRSIDKFTSLTSVDVSLDSSKGHNYEELFANNNITDLTVSGNLSNLKWLNNFSQLKVLIFKVYAENLDDYENFKYLENLEELTFHSSRFEHLDFLAECKKLKKLDLSISYSSSSYSNSNDVKLENIDFLNKLNELEELEISSLHDFMSLGGLSFSKKLKKLSLSVNTGVDVEFLLSCKQIKELSLSLSEDVDLKVLKNCESLESLDVSGFSNFHLYGKIKEINGFKGLSNLKTLSLGSFNISGVEDGKLMTELNTSINKSSTNNKDKIRVKKEDVNKVRNVIHYKGLPFNGIIFLEQGGVLFYEYEVVNGLKDGIYREFYGRTHSEVKEEKIREKIKFEAKFQKNEITEVLGFYNEQGINVIEGQNCMPNSILECKGSQFYHDDNAFTGFCFLEVETTAPSRWSSQSTPLFNQSLFELVDKSKSNPRRTDKVSLILKLQNGIITKDILVATKNKYTKISIVDEYDFSRLSDDDQSQYKDLAKEKFHRLYIYSQSYAGRVRHPLSQLPVMLEGDNNIPIKTLDGKSIVVTGVFENNSRGELKKIIESNGGKSSSSVSKNTSFILSGSKMGPNKKLKAEELNIKIIGEEEFIEKYASVSTNQKQTECESIPFLSVITDVEEDKNKWDYVAKRDNRPKLSSDNRKTFSGIKKLLISRDYDKIDEAVEKLVSLNLPELFETLLDSCEFHSSSGNRKLITNDFFNGSSPAQPFLNYAFFLIIANTPDNAEIHHSLIRNNMSSLNLSDFLSQSDVPDRFISIENFSSLTQLKLNLDIFLALNGYNSEVNKKVNRDTWFENNNITDLIVSSATGSLKWFKNFSDLKFLEFEFGFYNSEEMDLESFEFLENLEELNLSKINYGNYKQIKNLDFLRKCKKIRKLSLSIYDSYRDGDTLENLDFLKDLTNLEELSIDGVDGKINLDGLLSCRKLRTLSLDGNRSDTSKNFSFQLLKNCNHLEIFEYGLNQHLNISGKISDIDGLKGLKKLKFISLDKLDISADSEVFIS